MPYCIGSSITNAAGGSGTFSGGNAEVSLTVSIIKDAGTGFTITFLTKVAGASLQGLTTNSFVINVASIAITAQPAASYEYASGSSTVAPALSVSLRSATNENLDNASPPVTAVLSEASGSLIAGSVSSNTQTISAAGGQVTFSYVLSLEAGDSYRISASSMTASVTSSSFAVNPSYIMISTQPSSVIQYAASSSSVTTGSVVVQLKDGNGNTLTGCSTDGRSVTVVLQESSGLASPEIIKKNWSDTLSRCDKSKLLDRHNVNTSKQWGVNIRQFGNKS